MDAIPLIEDRQTLYLCEAIAQRWTDVLLRSEGVQHDRIFGRIEATLSGFADRGDAYPPSEEGKGARPGVVMTLTFARTIARSFFGDDTERFFPDGYADISIQNPL
ncbi:MAG: hypothetical protein FJY97_18335 [candidate division Zixibacteria bacterium]|nr:hypothetical protein [candidate division Zixibacteria bacterium]